MGLLATARVAIANRTSRGSGSPYLGHGVVGPYGTGIGEMRAAFRERRVEFARRDHAPLYKLGAHRFNRRRHVVLHGMARAEPDQERPVVDILQSRAPQKLKQILRQPHVAADVGKNLLERLSQTLP